MDFNPRFMGQPGGFSPAGRPGPNGAEEDNDIVPPFQIVRHPDAPPRLPFAIKDNVNGGFVTGGSPHFPRVFSTPAEAHTHIQSLMQDAQFNPSASSSATFQLASNTAAKAANLGAKAAKRSAPAPDPTPGLTIMKKAAGLAGVPDSWATDPYIWKLLGQESSSTQRRLNNTDTTRGSSAYGAFQFLNGTWDVVGAQKTNDPLEQAVAGLKYIKKIYGSPQKAWDHEIATWHSKQGPWY